MEVNDQEQYLVRLDSDRLPHVKQEHSLKIAESLLHICGLFKQWQEPRNGYTIFYVRTRPQDVPQAGVHWIDEYNREIMNPYTGVEMDAQRPDNRST